MDQFFSQRVSHLVVKGVAASPQKKAPSRRREGQSDNPFLDSTGATDLVTKAEKLGIKVWTVKSELVLPAAVADIRTDGYAEQTRAGG